MDIYHERQLIIVVGKNNACSAVMGFAAGRTEIDLLFRGHPDRPGILPEGF